MLNDVIRNLAAYGNDILFSVTVMVFLCAAATAGVRFLQWKSVSLRFYGVFLGINNVRLAALSLILIRLLFFWSFVVCSARLELTHICYGIIMTAVINTLLTDPGLFLTDILYTAVAYGELYGANLLRAYLRGVRFNIFVFIMLAVILIFVLVTTVYSSLLCVKSVVGKNRKVREKQRSKPKLPWDVIGQRGVLLAVGIFMTVIPYYYINRADTMTVRKDVYQYTSDGKRSYHGVNTITRSGLNCIIENKDRMQELDSTPLYYVNENKILIPSVASIIRPKISMTNRIINMSLLYEMDGQFYVKNEMSTVKVSDFFLYDGKDTYLFFEPVTISWEEKSMTLSPFSYITVKYNQNIRLYDKKTDTFSSVNTKLCNVTASMSCGATINLSTDILSVEDGKEKMLFLQPNLLEDLK